jgi:tetratricopeptide (TPR) repeat protein
MEIFQQSLDGNSDFGMGLDLGLRTGLWKNLNFSLVVHEALQHNLVLVERSEKTKPLLVGGLGWQRLNLGRDIRLALALDLEKQENREFKVRTGGEVTLYEALALRVGYDRDNFSFGLGLKSGRIRADYAYRLVDFTDGMHHVSLSFLLGLSTPERIRQRELAKLPPEPTAEEKRFAGLMDTANRFFRRFQLDSASYYFQQALDMQPANQEIIGTLAAIEESRRVQREQEEALLAAREDVTQTLHSFVAQAEQMLDQKMYRAALDLLNLIFDIDPINVEANNLRDRINNARNEELAVDLDKAQRAAAESQWFEAVEAYNRVLEIDPENATALQAKRQILAAMDLPEKIRLGIELYEKGQLIEARSRFAAILVVNPNEPVALDYLNRIRERLASRPAATLEDLQKDRVYWELYLEGLRHMRNKEYQRAIDVWEKVLEAYPNNTNTLNNIEQARLRLGTQAPEN